MVEDSPEVGFTVVEMVVALAVMSLFLTLFFQLFLTNQSQQLAVSQRTAASNIAKSNLNKITARLLIPGTTTACQSGGSSVNNTLDNAAAAGSIIATDKASAPNNTPQWSTAGLQAEATSGTSLPSTGVVQELRVKYPQGCAVDMPATIISTVSYGTESIVHATYVK